MKKRISLLLFMVTITATVYAQRSTEIKTLAFENGSSNQVFHLHNINGSVEVSTYEGNEVVIEVQKYFNKKRNSRSNLDINDINVTYVQDGNYIFAYIEAPGIRVRRSKKNDRYHIGYNMDNWWEEHRINFEFNFSIKVPRSTEVDISTMNDGMVYIKGVNNRIRANNLNGDIELENVAGIVDVNTLNGDIDVSFTRQPSENSTFKTLNGDIEVYFPENFSADITFKTLNGDMYTDFPDVTRLSNRVSSSSNNSKRYGGTRYRIDSFAPLRFGAGGPEHAFHSLNGNIYIKQRKI